MLKRRPLRGDRGLFFFEMIGKKSNQFQRRAKMRQGLKIQKRLNTGKMGEKRPCYIVAREIRINLSWGFTPSQAVISPPLLSRRVGVYIKLLRRV